MDEPENLDERRRVILHPRTAAARRFDRTRGNAIHVRGHTVDTDDVEQLLSTLLKSSLYYLTAVLIPLAVLMATIALVPAVRTIRPLGLAPLPWFLIGPVTLFSIALVAFIHERRTARFESTWSDEHRDTRP